MQSVKSGVSRALIGSKTIKCASAWARSPGTCMDSAGASSGKEGEARIRMRKAKEETPRVHSGPEIRFETCERHQSGVYSDS